MQAQQIVIIIAISILTILVFTAFIIVSTRSKFLYFKKRKPTYTIVWLGMLYVFFMANAIVYVSIPNVHTATLTYAASISALQKFVVTFIIFVIFVHRNLCLISNYFRTSNILLSIDSKKEPFLYSGLFSKKVARISMAIYSTVKVIEAIALGIVSGVYYKTYKSNILENDKIWIYFGILEFFFILMISIVALLISRISQKFKDRFDLHTEVHNSGVLFYTLLVFHLIVELIVLVITKNKYDKFFLDLLFYFNLTLVACVVSIILPIIGFRKYLEHKHIKYQSIKSILRQRNKLNKKEKEAAVETILRNQKLYNAFFKYTAESHSSELVLFCKTLIDYKELSGLMSQADIVVNNERVVNVFLKSGSPYEINISHKILEEVLDNVLEKNIDPFGTAYSESIKLLAEGYYAGFVSRFASITKDHITLKNTE
eukprot:GAHX01001755.1.p1 GENE.GAHX01001755.1~~GAHX01001755.1.p1  ORF type:complete len:429 (-),score=59.41 GAHX01001755.1:147-1433(-)